ncbi:alpha/beta hydrolase [candidate division KSB1 bacterium]|nr:alpha/beta hydrolase [candidate division KSB1 bacterium]MBL7094840.1 alpha/beta hydrolase [candidate division KSB1 bacterium]
MANKNIRIQLLWSEEDKSISAGDIQKLRNIIPNMAFQIVENAGHLSPYEKPDIVSRYLIDFLIDKTNY